MEGDLENMNKSGGHTPSVTYVVLLSERVSRK